MTRCRPRLVAASASAVLEDVWSSSEGEVEKWRRKLHSEATTAEAQLAVVTELRKACLTRDDERSAWLLALTLAPRTQRTSEAMRAALVAATNASCRAGAPSIDGADEAVARVVENGSAQALVSLLGIPAVKAAVDKHMQELSRVAARMMREPLDARSLRAVLDAAAMLDCRDAYASFLLETDEERRDIVALAARGLCAGCETAEPCELRSILLRDGAANRFEPVRQALDSKRRLVELSVLRALALGADALYRDEECARAVASNMLEGGTDTDATVRHAAHLGLTVWAAKARCQSSVEHHRILDLCLWQWSQHASKELLAATRTSFERTVDALIAVQDDAVDVIAARVVEALPASKRGRAAALEVLVRRGTTSPAAVWHTVLTNLANPDSGTQRAGAALAATAVVVAHKRNENAVFRLDDESASSLGRAFSSPATRGAASERLAPLLGAAFAEALNEAFERSLPDASLRVGAKLAAFARRHDVCFFGPTELEAALENSRVDVRVAALEMTLDRDDAFVAAVKTAVLLDAQAFPRSVLLRVARKAARRLVQRRSARFRDVVERLCDVALDGLAGDDSQQLAASEVLAGILETLQPSMATSWLATLRRRRHVVVRTLLACSWDRPRRLARDVLALLISSGPLNGESLDDEEAHSAIAAMDLAGCIGTLLRGSELHCKDAAAKLIALLECQQRAGVVLLPPCQGNENHQVDDEVSWWHNLLFGAQVEVEIEVCDRYFVVNDRGVHIDDAVCPGILLALGEFAASRDPSFEASSRVLRASRAALARTRDLLSRDVAAYAEADDDHSEFAERRRRGWHMCRAACACIEAYVRRSCVHVDDLVRCGESVLEDVLLTTRHSGAIAAAQATFQCVATSCFESRPNAVERWMQHCMALCVNGDDSRCAMRRSAGLAAAFVALVDATRDATAAETLLARVDDSRSVTAARSLHVVAALVAQCSRVRSPFYSRALAATLRRADDASWSVRSAAMVSYAALDSHLTAPHRRNDASADDEDAGAFAQYAGLREALETALDARDRPIALFAALDILSRIGRHARRSSRVALAAKVHCVLGHTEYSIRVAAASALNLLVRGDAASEFSEILRRDICAGDANTTHGALLACRTLIATVDLATAQSVAGSTLHIIERDGAPLLWAAAYAVGVACLERIGPRNDERLLSALEAVETRVATCGCGCDNLPGESLAHATMSALAVTRRLRIIDESVEGALTTLVGEDDDVAAAVARAATTFLRNVVDLSPDFEDDLDDDEDDGLVCDAAETVVSPAIWTILARASTSAVVYCLKHNSPPARRNAVFQLALTVSAGPPARTALLETLLDYKTTVWGRRWAPDVQAVALQLGAASLSDDTASLATELGDVAAAASDDASPLMLRRGAARAFALSPRLVAASDRSLVAVLRLASGADVDIQAAAARALSCCNGVSLAPHAAIRDALLCRLRNSSKYSNTCADQAFAASLARDGLSDRPTIKAALLLCGDEVKRFR